MRLTPSRAQAQYLLHKLHASFWFLPGCFAVASVAGACLALWADATATAALLEAFGPPFTMRMETARQLLSTLAGAVVTVLGLVFSLTLVALTVAAGNLGVRLLERYMGNRVTQTTMGLFIATFIFVVITLSGLELADDQVPHLTVTLATLLTVSCVVWLAFAFHDLATSLQVDEEAARIAKSLNLAITRLAEPKDGWSRSPDDATDDDGFDGVAVPADAIGYIQSIDEDRLAALAVRRGCAVSLAIRPGDYVIPTDIALRVRGDAAAVAAITEAMPETITVGARRTETDDLLFNVHLLLELAARALSPGINDHYTALGCVDHLTGCISTALSADLRRRCYRGADGTLRLETRTADVFDLIDTSLTSLRHNAAAHPAVLLRCLRSIGRLATACRDADVTRALSRHLELLTATALDTARKDADRQAIEAAARAAAAALALAPSSEDAAREIAG